MRVKGSIFPGTVAGHRPLIRHQVSLPESTVFNVAADLKTLFQTTSCCLVTQHASRRRYVFHINAPFVYLTSSLVGTPKYLANAMKSKGLQRLRWYCQVCQKQCRDENGFKCHAQSESHLRQMLVVGENAGRHIADFSGQFQSEFVALLSRR